MSDVGWDADDFEPKTNVLSKSKATDKWEGEDEDDDVKDNWDDEEQEKSEESQAVQVQKKKKPLKERLAEKEAKRKADLEEKRKQEEANRQPLTPEEQALEKQRAQQLQEESDLLLAKEAFGVTNDELAGRVGQLDTFEPDTKEDFDKFGTLLRDKVTKYDTSAHYLGFLETLFTDLSLNLNPEDMKKLSGTLTALSNEKTKALKTTKGKKAKHKGKLFAGKQATLDDYQLDDYDAMDDFI
ncbi:Eukaryotic translation initiation factor 3 subunit J-A [Lamellibrachia satsuma]|nr:Eukaryotic translation initiation factor 3 subunit J-A [Lamellibrachia satsuma]